MAQVLEVGRARQGTSPDRHLGPVEVVVLGALSGRNQQEHVGTVHQHPAEVPVGHEPSGSCELLRAAWSSAPGTVGVLPALHPGGVAVRMAHAHSEPLPTVPRAARSVRGQVVLSVPPVPTSPTSRTPAVLVLKPSSLHAGAAALFL